MVGPRGPHVDILLCSDTIVSILASAVLKDDRNRVVPAARRHTMLQRCTMSIVGRESPIDCR